MKRLSFVLVMLLVVPAARGQVTISGRVTDLETGEPLQGVPVDLRTPENTEPAERRETWTDAEGRYVLEDVPPGSWRVRAVYAAQAAGHVLATPVVEVGDRPLVFHFEMPVSAEPPAADPAISLPAFGVVKDAAGRALPDALTLWTRQTKGTLVGTIHFPEFPAAGAMVSLVGTELHKEAGMKGQFNMDGIEPGSYRLRVVFMRHLLGEVPVEIRAGFNEIKLTFDLPPGLPFGQ